MHKIILHSGKEKLPKNHHPWVFSGAIKAINGSPESGEVVALHASNGEFIAFGHFNANSRIRVRLLDWDKSVVIDENWYRDKIKRAISLRKEIMVGDSTDIYRLIYSEADFLPGLIVDIFGKYAVLQSLSAGMDRVKQSIAEILMEECDISGVYEKSDGDGRKMEKLAVCSGVLAGDEAPHQLEVQENGYRFRVGLSGQKTGFYTDQRLNRQIAAGYAKDKNILDLCCYTGAFSVYAMKNGACSITLCDVSKEALENAKQNLKLNEIDENKCRFIKGDGFQLLRELADKNEQYEMIILDPPKFVSHPKDLKRGLRGYKDINLNAMRVLKAGGILVTFSCSGAVKMDDLKQAVTFAAKDLGREVRILRQLHQSEDHPIRVSVSETEYLKGLVCVVG